MDKGYTKSVEDEIDWKVIDQLHTATLNFSSSSLEIKKLFFVLISIAIPSIIKLSHDKLDPSLFITLYVLITTFWFFDSFTYFYQEKLREKMERFAQIKSRNAKSSIISDTSKTDAKGFTIEPERTKGSRLCRSIFNPSVRFYWVLAIINSVGSIAYVMRWIK